MGYRIALALSATLPIAAFAHEGHGGVSAQSVLHHLAEPVHFGSMLLIVVVAWIVVRHKNGIQR